MLKQVVQRPRRLLFFGFICVFLKITSEVITEVLVKQAKPEQKASLRPEVARLGYKISNNQLLIPDNITSKDRDVISSKHYLTARFRGRLGNRMFVYASLLGIARHNNMIPCLVKDTELDEVFTISAIACPSEAGSVDEWVKFTEYRSAAYDERSSSLNIGINIELVGYFQSWKYFDFIKRQINAEFKFHAHVTQPSRAFLSEAVLRIYPAVPGSSVVYVGVHIRRGDMMEEYNQERGYRTADLRYLNKAMRYYAAKYSNIMFVVCSDDMPWAKQHVRLDMAPVVFSPFGEAERDLSLLSQTNHTIMTVGTYGWWAAWLAGGDVIYYTNLAVQDSSIDANLEHRDYFYKDWKGL